MDQFITTTRLARLAEKSAEGVRYDIRAGKLIPDARTDSGAALFSLASGERYAAAQRQARKDARVAA